MFYQPEQLAKLRLRELAHEAARERLIKAHHNRARRRYRAKLGDTLIQLGRWVKGRVPLPSSAR